MKSRTISIIVAVTITLTLFVALAVCILNPFNESNSSHPIALANNEVPAMPERHEVEPLKDEVNALINDNAFQKALSEVLEEKLGDEKLAESLSKSIIETDAFKNEVAPYLESSNKVVATAGENDINTFSNLIPIAELDSDGDAVSDDDYAVQREESGTSEIERALRYLGY